MNPRLYFLEVPLPEGSEGLEFPPNPIHAGVPALPAGWRSNQVLIPAAKDLLP